VVTAADNAFAQLER